MVTVTHTQATARSVEERLDLIAEGLDDSAQALLAKAERYAFDRYGDSLLGSGESVYDHAVAVAVIVAGLKLDLETRLAALLFAAKRFNDDADTDIAQHFGQGVMTLVRGMSELDRMHPIIRERNVEGEADGLKHQVELLRKMLLATVEDIRVVLLRLSSRTQTLRYLAHAGEPHRHDIALDTLDIYAPLANRLGVWELKWELEDRSFRLLHPQIYRKIALQLDSTRLQREAFIERSIAMLAHELAEMGIEAQIYGRPKHIYSIWNKMQKKGLDFAEVYDTRAIRVIVGEVGECYSVLGVIHQLWQPIAREFDDYIAHPKGNRYQSLHTVVHGIDGLSLEVQIRTAAMHHYAELGVAAHWRYKEGSAASDDPYDSKIAWLRQIVTWRDDGATSTDWAERYKEAALDETIYVITPQGRVIDLPRGATAVDFAYRIHTNLGHRCRGARIDAVLLPLNTPLETGQRVDIITAKSGGPSRDWLNPQLGYIFTKSARHKVRQWFAAEAQEATLQEGRALVQKELQRQGKTALAVDDLAHQLGFTQSDAFYHAVAKGDLSLRQLQRAIGGDSDKNTKAVDDGVALRPPQPLSAQQPVLMHGVAGIKTQMARCCHPTPPEAIGGFISREHGVVVHRQHCRNYQHLVALYPERLIDVDWNPHVSAVFGARIQVLAEDRQGLLRDISDVFTGEKINVTAVNTQSKKGEARMHFTVEVGRLSQLQGASRKIMEVEGVLSVHRL